MKRRRAIVRAFFWGIVGAFIWAGVSSIETRPSGWEYLAGTAIALLILLSVLVWRLDSNRAGHHGTR